MNKVEKFFLYITSTLLFLSMFLMGFSSVCHAETTGSFPYVVPLNQDLNSSIPADIYLQADSLVRQTYNLTDNDTVLWFVDTFDIVVDELGEYGQNSLTFIINPYTRGYTESFDYLTSSVNVSFQNGGTIEFRWTGAVRGPYGFGGGSKALLGSYSSSSITHGSITRLYPFYMSGPDVLGYPLIDGGNDPIAIIFTNNIPYDPSVPEAGHATQPGNDPNNFINGSNNLPITKPVKPTINNYTWNTWTSPGVDTSTVETLLESLIDNVSSLFSWLSSNLAGEFNNLSSNIDSLFDYLVQSIENGFNKVIKSIQDLADDLFNNFVSLFEPITQQLSYITQSVDPDLIVSEVQNTDLINDYSSINTLKDDFISVFTDTSEPNSFSIPLHLEDISILNTGIQYIDLSVINPVKSIIRAFAWVITSFGLVVTIIDAIPNYINGGGDE